MEWISVKDRFPEFDVNVLLYWKDDEYEWYEVGYLTEIRTRKSSEGISSYAEWNFNDNYGDTRPTHWQELLPPKLE